MKKYIELYPDSLTSGNGLIKDILSNFDFSNFQNFSAESAERAYCLRSGGKYVFTSFSAITDEQRVDLISSYFGEKWKKLIDDFTREYNPMDAYSVTESGNRKADTTENNSTNFGRTSSENGTDTGTVVTENGETRNTDDSVYGFNSLEDVPSDKSVDATNSAGTETRDLKTSNTITHGGTDTRNGTENRNEEYSFTRKGNIGYTTPQDLLKQEFELWSKTFFEIMFTDIDNFITIMVYNI